MILNRLIAIEWLKIRRRTVFWVVVLVPLSIIMIGLGVQQYLHHLDPKVPGFSLPDGWVMVISTGTSIGMIMLLIGVALLTASETTWRTQRQNVIDGLSRAQYFGAKVTVAAMLAIIVWAAIPIAAFIVALFGGDGAVSMPVITSPAHLMLPNALLYLLAIGVMGVMFGMLASSSGAAVGLALAYIVIEPVIGGIMASKGGGLRQLSEYLPFQVFGNLVSRHSYDATVLARMTERLAEMGRPAPMQLSTSVILTIIYIAAFLGLTWLAFRTRDL